MTDMTDQQPKTQPLRNPYRLTGHVNTSAAPTAGASQNSITKTRTREPKSGCIGDCND